MTDDAKSGWLIHVPLALRILECRDVALDAARLVTHGTSVTECERARDVLNVVAFAMMSLALGERDDLLALADLAAPDAQRRVTVAFLMAYVHRYDLRGRNVDRLLRMVDIRLSNCTAKMVNDALENWGNKRLNAAAALYASAACANKVRVPKKLSEHQKAMRSASKHSHWDDERCLIHCASLFVVDGRLQQEQIRQAVARLRAANGSSRSCSECAPISDNDDVNAKGCELSGRWPSRVGDNHECGSSVSFDNGCGFWARTAIAGAITSASCEDWKTLDKLLQVVASTKVKADAALSLAAGAMQAARCTSLSDEAEARLGILSLMDLRFIEGLSKRPSVLAEVIRTRCGRPSSEIELVSKIAEPGDALGLGVDRKRTLRNARRTATE